MEIKITFSENIFLNDAITEHGGEITCSTFREAGRWILEAAKMIPEELTGYDKTPMVITFSETRSLHFRMDLVHPSRRSNSVVAAIIRRLDSVDRDRLSPREIEDYIEFRSLVFNQIESELVS